MKKLINSPKTVVDDMLAGLTAACPHLSVIAGQRVVLRSDIEAFKASGRVALISGGGTGHEPAHAGYVGEGMLTAAVCGDVFTSPPTESVLAAIRAVASPAGVLLIVKNYTGDRLNFKLAAEQARAEGIAVETVLVADDVALSASTESAGRRGIAGTVLVHKAAGAAAAQGLPLAEVKARAEAVAAAIGTIGVGLSACTVPAAGKPNFSLGDSEIELGLGIHGEPGVRREEITPARELVSGIVDAIADDRRLVAETPVALLVNNLGATPLMEIAIVTGAAIAAARARGLDVRRVWSGAFLTALDMAGVSISLLPVDDATLALLDAPTAASAWGGSGVIARSHPESIEEPRPADSAVMEGEADPRFAQVLGDAMRALVAAEEPLTELDRLSGDGDLGANLARGAQVVLEQDARIGALPPAAALAKLSAVLGKSVGGTSGVLYAAGLARAGAALAKTDAASASGWATALRAAAGAISDMGDAREGDRTMLDALIPAARALEEALSAGRGDALSAMVTAAQQGAENTASMVSRRGRASYLGDRAKGTTDAGAVAVSLWLAAVRDSLGRG